VLRRGAGIVGVSAAVFWLAAIATATPRVRFVASPVPIAGYPHTGNIAGTGEAIKVEYEISGTEYGGYPPPLTGFALRLPPGTEHHPSGFPVCPPSEIESADPRGLHECNGRKAGPLGTALIAVAFGSKVIPENAIIEPFYAPDGGISFFMFGHEPVLVEALSRGRWLDAGGTLAATTPLVETVPGGPLISTRLARFSFGSALRADGTPLYYLRAPATCPKGYLPFGAKLTFAGEGGLAEQKVDVDYRAPCPLGATSRRHRPPAPSRHRRGRHRPSQQ